MVNEGMRTPGRSQAPRFTASTTSTTRTAAKAVMRRPVDDSAKWAKLTTLRTLKISVADARRSRP